MTATPGTTANSLKRVRNALKRAQADGSEVTVASIARTARVDRAFIYRRPDLLAAIQASRTPALTDDDKHAIPVPLKMSANELALIDEARGEAPRMQWMRLAVMEKLARELGVAAEDLDGAKRPAPRRRNYNQRAAKEET